MQNYRFFRSDKMEYLIQLTQLKTADLLKIVIPLLILIITTIYKYLLEDRISIEYVLNIVINIVNIATLYYVFYTFSNLVYGEIAKVNFSLYFPILIFLEFIYLININKMFKVVKYKNAYYKLVSHKKEYLKVQDYNDSYLEYSDVSSSIDKYKKKNNFKVKENLKFKIISYKEFIVNDDFPVETTTYYLDKESSKDRDLNIKRKIRITITFGLLIIYFFIKVIPISNIEKLLPMVIFTYFCFMNFYIVININKIRLSNKLHIQEALIKLNKGID